MNPKLLLLLLSGCSFVCFNVALSAEELVSTNYPRASFTFNFTNANGVVTNKIIRLESTNVNEIIAAWGTNYVKFFSSLTNASQTNSTPDPDEMAAAAFCLTNDAFSVMTNSALLAEVTQIIAGAATFFQDLKEQGRLPGVSKDKEGDGGLNKAFKNDLLSSQKIRYPVLLTIHMVWADDPCTNYYTVKQPSKDSGWQLQRAWRADSEGHVIKEWLVK